MATVLVVDDRDLNREFLRMLLSYAGHRVVDAADGAQALERVRKERPDVVITDIVMPTMDGIEFFRRLRADAATAQIPVVFYTATYRLGEARKLAQPYGLATVIPKPSRPQVILDAVAAAVGAATAADRPAAPQETGVAAINRLGTLSYKNKLDSLSLRLATLIELSLDLAAESDPQRLIDLACGAAEAIFSARVAAIGVLGTGGEDPGRFAVRGVTDAMRAQFAGLDLRHLLSDGRPRRFNEQAAAMAVLPAWHPPVRNLLIVPLKSARRALGWLYLADRVGVDTGFGELDEQLGSTLATQLAQAYENLVFLSETSAYAVQLEAEIAERKRAQEALLDSEAHFRALFDHAPIGMAVVSPAGRLLRVNRALCKLLDYAEEDLKNLGVDAIVAGDDSTAVISVLASDVRPLEEREMRYRRRDGSLGWMVLDASLLRDGAGNPLHFILQIQDIDERKKGEEILQMAASVYNNTMDGIIVTDTEARIISVNPAFTTITGYSAEEAIGQKPSLMCSERTTLDFYREMWEALLRDGRWEGEIWNRRKSGDAFLEWLTVSMIPGPDGNPSHYVGVFNDITELRRKDERIRHLAFHDPLTGLPNRTLLFDRLEHRIAFAAREKQRLGFMFIDLDRFKAVNDSLGHDIGDGLLKEVAHRLNRCVRHSDTVARMGGDEFVILLENTGDLADYGSLARKALDSLSQPVTLDGHTIQVGASIGISCFPGDGSTVRELMQNADAAMYEAKAAGRNTYRFFQPATTEDAAQRLTLEMELRNAVANRELELYYQPTVFLGRDAPFGVEAMLRWRHPVHGLVLPADFIPLAEETGIIAELGDWVLDEACRQCSVWQARGLGRIRIAVTVAAKQLQQGDLAARIASAAQRHGISPADLEIKLTESVILANRGHVEGVLARLREIGVVVAVDDYGSGAFSSLAYLRRLPIDMLSIDRSFVSKADNDEEDGQFVRSIVALGRALKLTVVAEGVETESQADFLRECGCSLSQGYLYARPAPAADVEAWLLRHIGGDVAAPAGMGQR